MPLCPILIFETATGEAMIPQGLYVVGERLNEPTMSDHLVRGWEETWDGDSIFKTPAFPPGISGDRLRAFLGCPWDKAINLLPPDNKPGTWAATAAQRAACLTRLPLNAYATGAILLGQKVAEAYGYPLAEFGDVVYIDFIPALVFPHPSPLNRLWQDDDFEQDMKRKAARFIAEIVDKG